MAGEKKGIKIKSSISKKLAGRGNISAYGEKLKELSSVASEMAPEGSLVVALFDRSEVYGEVSKVIKDLLDFESFYSHKAIQANPKLTVEYGKIAEHMQEIGNIIGKRRKLMFPKKDTKKTETKGE